MPDNEPNGTPAASTDAAGQRPTDGTQPQPQSQTSSTTSEQQPTADSAASGQQPTNGQQPEDVRDPVAKARAETEAKYRTQLRAAEKERDALLAEKQQRADADLSAQQRAEKQAAEWQQKHVDLLRVTQERIVRYEIEKQASKINIIDPDAAVKLLDWAQLEYDDEGMPKNAGTLLSTLAKEKPYLVAPKTPVAPPQPPAPTSVGANPANPTRSASSSGALSYEYIESLSSRQIADLPADRRLEILNWMAANPKPARPQ